MELEILEKILALRAQLHVLAERSGSEHLTKVHLIAFLGAHTTLRIDEHDHWFCALHQETDAIETIAFRADMDALPTQEGASHLCGHDGHSAALAGLGLWLEGKKLGRNVVLIFQHAEETGEGGAVCARSLPSYGVQRIYAFHNIPGWETGTILLRPGPFACASRGMTLSFTGAPSHAAYPEQGRNPGFAAARLMTALPELTNPDQFKDLAVATLVGSEVGAKTFGSAAGVAEVWLTVRAARTDDLTTLVDIIKTRAEEDAARDGVFVEASYCDVFPATYNDSATLSRLEALCKTHGLSCAAVPEPFRWSEDFGHYGALVPAVMVGIGAGIDWPPLHTENYVFNDDILPTALTLFSLLASYG